MTLFGYYDNTIQKFMTQMEAAKHDALRMAGVKSRSLFSMSHEIRTHLKEMLKETWPAE